MTAVAALTKTMAMAMMPFRMNTMLSHWKKLYRVHYCDVNTVRRLLDCCWNKLGITKRSRKKWTER